ncbi:MAG: bifunctional metallophosphatase/5'-nucleotidase, partial [Gemmatimonadota bacterium]
VTPDPAIDRLVGTYVDAVAARAREVVTILAEPLTKHGREGEFALGRLIADAQRTAVGTQIAIMNNGGIRRGLPEGPITYGDLFELQPFQNTLVRLELKGEHLLAALEHALDGERGVPTLQISGLDVRYEPEAPTGSRVLEARLPNGTPVRPDGVYSVAVNDFMAGGGSGYTMLMKAAFSELTGLVDLDALVDHLERLPRPVRPPLDPRWIAVGG